VQLQDAAARRNRQEQKDQNERQGFAHARYRECRFEKGRIVFRAASCVKVYRQGYGRFSMPTIQIRAS
jgi:hypothetical protein